MTVAALGRNIDRRVWVIVNNDLQPPRQRVAARLEDGMDAERLMAALIVFFPLTINVITGLRSAPQSLRDLFRALNATRLEMLLKLELPATLPFLFAGLRISGTLSVVGAITAEFVSTGRGLGYLVNLGKGLYDTPLVMAGVVSIVALALSLYALVRLIERWVVRH